MFPWAVSYAVPYSTPVGVELIEVVPAKSKHEAVQRFEAAPNHREMKVLWDGIQACAYWPPLPEGQSRPTKANLKAHAWFIAYLQAVDSAGRPLLDIAPRVAFSVLVEFGGSGGRAAGPIAKEVADVILDVLGPELDPDAKPEIAGS